MPSGGGTLKHWITMRALGRLNRRFLAILDSDRTSAADPISADVLRRQRECKEQGGACIILRKREIENYLHADALVRAGHPRRDIDDYGDVKVLFGHKRISYAIEHMTTEEILARDRYLDATGKEHHELVDIARTILALPDQRGRRPRSTRGRATELARKSAALRVSR